MKEIINYAKQMRWKIHQIAELSYEEKLTQELICAELEAMGVRYEKVPNCYGVVGFLGDFGEQPPGGEMAVTGKKSSSAEDGANRAENPVADAAQNLAQNLADRRAAKQPLEAKNLLTIALRADTDALPIAEQTGCAHACEHGRMHACGHDFHTAALLAFAKACASGKITPAARVKVIFQPAEEASPKGGARYLLASGLLDDVDEIYGMHVWPDEPVGTLVAKAGDLMAASDHFYVDIAGRASHAAQPHKGIDALAAAADFVQGAYGFFARRMNAFAANVLTIGTLRAGSRYNVLAGSAQLEGTVRTYDAAHRDLIERQLGAILRGTDERWGTASTLRYERGYPALINDAECAKKAAAAAERAGLKVVRECDASMCGEDFAVYLQRLRGAFLWLGVGGEYALHHEKFLANEEAFECALRAYAELVGV